MVLALINNTVGEEQSRCTEKAAASDELNISGGTASTEIITEAAEEQVVAVPATTRPAPIVINEDDLERTMKILEKLEHEPEHVKETHFHHSLLNDSVHVGRRRRKVNDTEVHEKNPHLQDFLVPHHSHHFDQPDEADAAAGDKSDAENDDPCADAQDAKKDKIEAAPAAPAHGILHVDENTSPAVEEPQDKPKTVKHQVSFGTVLVRDYDMILGDHPCCSYGPPITIDWDYLEYEPLDVNEYEFHHPPRRSLREMGLNYYQRKKLLSDAGFTEVDFKNTKKIVNKAKMNRSMTRQFSSYPYLKAESAVESAGRKFKRLLKDDHWKADKKTLKRFDSVKSI